MDAKRWRGVYFGLLVLLGGCSSQVLGSRSAFMTFPEIRVSLPEGAIDKTRYAFTSNERELFLLEELTFSHDVIPVGVSDLGSLVTYRINQLQGVTPGEVNVGEEAAIQLDRYAGRKFRVEQSAGGKSIRTYCVMALGAQNDYIQLTYSAPYDETESSARFREIYESVRFGDLETGLVRQGYTRRSVRIATLNVPSKLRPPSQLAFEFAGKNDRIDVTVALPGVDAITPLSTLIAQDAALAGSSRSILTDTVAVDGGVAEVVHYVLTKRGSVVEESAVWRAIIRFTSGTIVSAVMRSPNDARGPERRDVFYAFVRQVRQQS